MQVRKYYIYHMLSIKFLRFTVHKALAELPVSADHTP